MTQDSLVHPLHSRHVVFFNVKDALVHYWGALCLFKNKNGPVKQDLPFKEKVRVTEN